MTQRALTSILGMILGMSAGVLTLTAARLVGQWRKERAERRLRLEKLRGYEIGNNRPRR